MPTVYIAGDSPSVGVTAVATGLSALFEGVSGRPSVEEWNPIDDAAAGDPNARVVLVCNPSSANPAQAASTLGDRILGVIINAVPEHGRHGVLTTTVPSFEERGIRVLGVLPEDRRMLAPTVGDVAEHLGAECINRSEMDDPDEALAALVEHFMLGGLFLDTGVYVFGKHEQKAVIVRGDRPDLQMAALDTSTVCLVLTEGRLPVQYIVHHAALNQVPMLLVNRPTLETMEALHTIGERVTVHSPHKSRRFAELLSAHCDLAPLVAASAA